MTLNHAMPSEINFTISLLTWYDKHGRKDLPWQKNRYPYDIWISEIMLQQTQVETVIPYFLSFMKRFPDIQTLAKASIDEVMACWAGLGYYARARNLHKAALMVRDLYGGKFPVEFEQVLSLPGIGRSTAGAILAFSSNARHPILDGNVKRVLTRLYTLEGIPGSRKIENQLWEIADRLTPAKRVADYSQAIMDMGARICKRSSPLCLHCPVTQHCRAYAGNSVSIYPTRKPAAARRSKTCRMLLLKHSSGSYLLEKRPPHGIWGGLWCPPQLDDQNIIIDDFCRDSFGIATRRQQSMSTVKHGFTHFDLLIVPHLCDVTIIKHRIIDGEHYLWYNPHAGKIVGLPAAVAHIFNILEEVKQ